MSTQIKLILLLTLFQCSFVSADEYTFGVVPQFEASQLHRIWRPILKELENKTGHSFKMTGTASIQSFEEAFFNGRYDFAYMNPWHSLLAFEKLEYRPVVRDSTSQLYGALFVHKDSNINELKELSGKKVAFPAQNALGASMLLRADLKLLFGVEVEPVYVGTHSSVYMNIALKQVQAGGGVMRSFNEQKPSIQSRLKKIYTTRAIPPHPIIAHSRISTAITEQVRKAFIEMAEKPETRKLLAKIPLSKPIAAYKEDYQILKQWRLNDFYVP